MTEQEQRLKYLKRRRGALKAAVTRFTNYVKRFGQNGDIEELTARLRRHKTLYEDFEVVQTDIECLTDYEENDGDDDDDGVNEIKTIDADGIDDDESERKYFEDKYFAAIAAAQKIIDSHSAISTTIHGTPALITAPTTDPNGVRLPVINLPEFNGSYENWFKFRDAFQTLVDNNTSLSNVQKFMYLSSSLKKPASDVIESLEISNANYPIALNLLRERYENNKLIINSHVRAWFELEVITKENHASLRKLVDEFMKHFRALEALGQPVGQWDTLLIYILSNKLDVNTRKTWEMTQTANALPTINDLLNFLKTRCQLLETIHSNNPTTKVYAHDKVHKTKALVHVSQRQDTCVICNKTHTIYQCSDFSKLSPKERLERVKKLKLCTNCLIGNHDLGSCKSRNCYKCGKRHHTLLHVDVPETEDIKTAIATHCMTKTTHALLSTAWVDVETKEGRKFRARALLDSGSDSNYITEEFFEKLGTNRDTCDPITVVGVNRAVTRVDSATDLTIKSTNTPYTKNLTFLIIQQITQEIPSITFDTSDVNFPKSVILADDTYNVRGRIDMLIGAEIFYELLTNRRIHLGKNKPVLTRSKLGWLVTGRIHSQKVKNTICNLAITRTEDDTRDALERFWKLEDCSETYDEGSQNVTVEKCEEHFKKHTVRDEAGRYEVALPFNERTKELGESLLNAVNRFHKLERRLNTDAVLKKDYVKFMQEYLELNHMTKVRELTDDVQQQTTDEYYIPHHSVIKTSSSTTKLRVVFDASAPSDTGVSLNDILYVGPIVQSELLSILIRFRKHKIIMTADVEKMFRQVRVKEEHRSYQRIVWRKDASEPLTIYQLNTVTYGTGPATFLTTRCIKDLALSYKETYPRAAQALLRDTYVDDVITGCDNDEDAIELRNEMTTIMQNGCFNLRKWSSNCKDVLKRDTKIGSDNKHLVKDASDERTLGIVWDRETDVLKFAMGNDRKPTRSETKRTILAAIAKIFDPLGLLSPIVILGKMLLQQLWLCKLGWDEQIPLKLQAPWKRLQAQTNELNKLEIPRRVFCDNAINIQLCGFCDSSEKAYGAVVYCRSEDAEGQVKIALLCSKSRVAPLKKVSLPRLELCGAVLLAKLMHNVVKWLDEEITRITYFTDSTIVLYWIKSEPNKWKTFVANRVATIQSLSDTACWNHVSGKDNPADIVSRGMTVDQLNDSIWWTGPDFLKKDCSEWTRQHDLNIEHNEEVNTRKTVLLNIRNEELMGRYSSLTKLQRIVAYCIRFYRNLRGKCRLYGPLSVEETQDAHQRIIRLCQEDEFEKEISDLRRNGQVSKTSNLLPLTPFVDEDGILRVGGRLERGDFGIDKKHPIILPKKHILTTLIIRYEHNRNFHAGAQATLAFVRERYWPIAGKNAVKQGIRSCVTCFKYSPRQRNVIMASLPKTRITPTKPFTHTALDMAGPFLVKESKFRNKKIIKSYACIFVCFSTKAVHIEVTTDLTCETFLACLQRFVARRGIPSTLYSDNGRSFVAADKELRAAYKSFIETKTADIMNSYLLEHQITWKFMPARAPHFGGLHEAAVKSMKNHLKKITKTITLTLEGLITVLTRVEAILNSRPLYPSSDDPNDPSALTPGHFLIGTPLNALPVDVDEIKDHKLCEYNKLTQITMSFWRRWRQEYLNSLQARSKWRRNQGCRISVGDLVLIREDIPVQCWPMGRVLQLHPGPDGEVRVVTLKTKGGITKRATNNLYVLPKDSPSV